MVPGGATDLDWEGLLEIMRRRGVECYATPDGRVRVRGPSGSVTPTLLAALKEFEAEVRRLVDGQWSRRVRREDTGEVVSQWQPLQGHSDWDYLQRAADACPGATLLLEAFRSSSPEEEMQWRTFAKLVAPEGSDGT